MGKQFAERQSSKLYGHQHADNGYVRLWFFWVFFFFLILVFSKFSTFGDRKVLPKQAFMNKWSLWEGSL